MARPRKIPPTGTPPAPSAHGAGGGGGGSTNDKENTVGEEESITAPESKVYADLTVGVGPVGDVAPADEVPEVVPDPEPEPTVTVEEAVPTAPADDLDDLSKNELKARADLQALDTRGNKTDLKDRLRDDADREPGSDPEPGEPKPTESVTFRCERWAGVRLHGTNIKFEDHYFTTSNEGEIARLDAWEHAERVD